MEVLVKDPMYEFRKGASDYLQLPLNIAGSIFGVAVGMAIILLVTKLLLFVMGG